MTVHVEPEPQPTPAGPSDQIPMPKAGLWKASDGSFVRWTDWPCMDNLNIDGLSSSAIRFADEGRLLAGPDAVIEVETGKAVHCFTQGKTRSLSPSGTYLACLDDSTVLRLFDGRTGLEVWRRDFQPKDLAPGQAASKVLTTLFESPDPQALAVRLGVGILENHARKGKDWARDLLEGLIKRPILDRWVIPKEAGT